MVVDWQVSLLLPMMPGQNCGSAQQVMRLTLVKTVLQSFHEHCLELLGHYKNHPAEAYHSQLGTEVVDDISEEQIALVFAEEVVMCLGNLLE